ncbi:cytochrome P450 4B1-like isoform X2 [Corticium candelabrum]|nr:cytochrome P450 4B1-like isoform X2 [Corticium candelabrum]
MLDLWSSAAEKNEPVEVFKYASHMSLDVLLQCIFSCQSDCQTGVESSYVNAVYELSEIVVDRILYPPYHSNLIHALTPAGWRFRRAKKFVHDFSQKVISDRRKAIKNKDTSDKLRKRKYLDFLDILIEAKDENGVGLTDSEIRDEVDTFMFEGHDTTSSGIGWALYCLAKYPEYQQKCRDEVEGILHDGKTELQWDDMNSLVFTTQCIKEAMRLFPPVPNVHRDVTSDIQLSDCVLPKGAWAWVDIFSLHHNPHVWDNPEEFRPSRFSPENSKGRHPYAYVPFSAGPRNCIGQNFALNEERMAVAMTVYRYELIEVKDHTFERLINVTLKAKGGIKICLKLIPR